MRVTRGAYTDYTAKDRTKIRIYAAINGPARATDTARCLKQPGRRLKSEYFVKSPFCDVISLEICQI